MTSGGQIASGANSEMPIPMRQTMVMSMGPDISGPRVSRIAAQVKAIDNATAIAVSSMI